MGSVQTFGDRVASTAGDVSASAFGGIADLTGIVGGSARSRMTHRADLTFSFFKTVS
jgi:hypothetical protein